MAERRTKRRYAHELFPHAEEGETRSLAVDVPYLYALAIGNNVQGTGWFDRDSEEAIRRAAARIMEMIRLRELALTADALLQGMAGDEAWSWAMSRAAEESGEWIWERARVYGVDADKIKPYPCGLEPGRHEHLGAPDARGFRTVTTVAGRESDCEACTEPVPTEGAAR